jgi:hypothetical protein
MILATMGNVSSSTIADAATFNQGTLEISKPIYLGFLVQYLNHQ